MHEDAILGSIDLERALAKLHPADRDLVVLVARLGPPPGDWLYPWPAKYEHIGSYIGLKYEGKPLSEAAVRYRLAAIEAMWRGERGDLRRKPR